MGNIQGGGDKQAKPGKSPSKSKNFIKNLNRKSPGRDSRKHGKKNQKLNSKKEDLDPKESDNDFEIEVDEPTSNNKTAVDKEDLSSLPTEEEGRSLDSLTVLSCQAERGARSTNRESCGSDGQNRPLSHAHSRQSYDNNGTTDNKIVPKTDVKKDSSSDSVFTDPLTPVAFTEINQCYYSAESDSTIEDQHQLVSNKNVSEIGKSVRSEKLSKINNLSISQINQIDLNDSLSVYSEGTFIIVGDSSMPNAQMHDSGINTSMDRDSSPKKESSDSPDAAVDCSFDRASNLKMEYYDSSVIEQEMGSLVSLGKAIGSPEWEKTARELGSDFTEHRLKASPAQMSFTLSKHRKVELTPTKINDAVLNDSAATKEHRRHSSVNDGVEATQAAVDSNVLRKVASLTLDQASLDSKISRPKFVPEKLDFQLYEKFEGQMLVNWFAANIAGDQYFKNVLSLQDLKMLGVQYCTHLLAVGVLRQIVDKNAPSAPVFKPDLMYYWAHTETPSTQPITPGKIQMLNWPPTFEASDKENIKNLDYKRSSNTSVQDSISLFEQNDSLLPNDYSTSLKDDSRDMIKLLSELQTRTHELNKYKTLLEIQNLTQSTLSEFSSISREEASSEQTKQQTVATIATQTEDYCVEALNLLVGSSAVIKIHENNFNTNLEAEESALQLHYKDLTNGVLKSEVESNNKLENKMKEIENYCKLNKSRDCKYPPERDKTSQGVQLDTNCGVYRSEIQENNAGKPGLSKVTAVIESISSPDVISTSLSEKAEASSLQDYSSDSTRVTKTISSSSSGESTSIVDVPTQLPSALRNETFSPLASLASYKSELDARTGASVDKLPEPLPNITESPPPVSPLPEIIPPASSTPDIPLSPRPSSPPLISDMSSKKISKISLPPQFNTSDVSPSPMLIIDSPLPSTRKMDPVSLLISTTVSSVLPMPETPLPKTDLMTTITPCTTQSSRPSGMEPLSPLVTKRDAPSSPMLDKDIPRSLIVEKSPPPPPTPEMVPPPPPMPEMGFPPPPLPGMGLPLPPMPEMVPPPPPMPALGPPPPPMPGMGPPPPPMPGMGPPPPPMPGMGPPPPPMPGMGPPPPPMPGMGPPPPPMPGMGPTPPPMPGMGPPPPPMPGMGPPPPPMPGMGPPPPPMPGLGPPPPPLPGMGPPPPPLPGMQSPGMVVRDPSYPSGDPPPPPGPGGPVPFPAPPVGGWNPQRASLRKTAVMPTVPMKPLYWTRILSPITMSEIPATNQIQPNTPDIKPLWLEIEETDLDNISEFCDLFSRQVVTRKPTKKKVAAPTKIQPIKILDSKRSQNVGILAQSLHVEFSEIENAIYNFDTSVVSLEALQQIYELRATEEEISQIKDHIASKAEVPLDKPEAFLHDLSSIPNFAERISCFMFQADFEDSISTIMHKLDNLKNTCEFLISNETLKKLFAIILTLGNYMNGGNIQRGQADGFGLEILSRLRDVKSKESTVTLLHFIVRTYVRQCGGALHPDCVLPIPEPGDIDRAAAVNFDDIRNDLNLLTKQLEGCQLKSKKVIETENSLQKDSSQESASKASTSKKTSVFEEKMTAFLDTAENKLKVENENLEECHTKFFATMKFYQFIPKTGKLADTQPKDFFVLWASFCVDFKDIFKKEEQIAIKEKLKEARIQQGDRKYKVQPKKEGGLKAKLQKLAAKK